MSPHPSHGQPSAKKQKTSLLPSADELFDAIDAPAFFRGGGAGAAASASAAQRQAAEITASQPRLPTLFPHPPVKKPKQEPKPPKPKVGGCLNECWGGSID